MSVESDRAAEDVSDIFNVMGQETSEATLRFLDRLWFEVDQELEFTSVFRPILTVERIWQGWAEALLAYTDDLGDVPLRAIVRLATVAVPTVKRLDSVVVRGSDCYRFAATQVAETLLDYVGGQPLPASFTAWKNAERWLDTAAFLRFMDISAGLRALKGQLIGRILSVIRLSILTGMTLIGGLIVFRLIVRANEPGADTDLPSLAQDSKRIGGIKRGQHRVNRRTGPDR